jgi:hypothetical protein
MLRVIPDGDWFREFFQQSQPLMRHASGPQLANIGYALTFLRCLPPRQWVHEWLRCLRKKLHSGTKPYGIKRELWHGIGYSVHAKRAAVAISAFREEELQDWCRWLQTPMPRVKAQSVNGITKAPREEVLNSAEGHESESHVFETGVEFEASHEED